MVKLTYGQANALTSPVIQQLFQNPSKAFPFVDAFRLTNLVSQLDGKMLNYKAQMRKLVESLGGKIGPDGRVIFDNPNAQVKFGEKLDEINQETFEIEGNPVYPQSNWPNLSLAEVAILSPLLAKEEDNAKERGGKVTPLRP